MKTALYCRVSTEEQARTGESILDQRQALERWARDYGHEIIGVYEDEGFSAHKSYKSRPGLSQLLDDVRAGKVELIAFTKFDRWTRRAADYYELQEVLDRHHVPWTAILEDYETVTADGRFKVGIMLSVNQHEAERTSERIKFTFAEKRRRGEIISGNMPKGYKLIDKKPVKDPETEAGMNAFWRTYLSGAGLKPSILAAESRGVHLSTSTGSFILRNAEAYTGKIQGVSCEAYITEEDAARVLATRKIKAKASGYTYLFTGLLYCGECAHRMGGHRNFWEHKDGSRGFQVYYNCSHRYRTNQRECSNSVNIYESDIERALVFGLSDAIEAEAVKMEAQIAEMRRQREAAWDVQPVREKLERRKRRAWEAYLDEIIDKKAYQREAAKIDAELAKIVQVPQIDEDAPRKIRETMPEGWRELYFKLDAQHRREFWLQTLQRIDVYPDRSISITVKPGENPFITRIQRPDGYWIEIVPEKK